MCSSSCPADDYLVSFCEHLIVNDVHIGECSEIRSNNFFGSLTTNPGAVNLDGSMGDKIWSESFVHYIQILLIPQFLNGISDNCLVRLRSPASPVTSDGSPQP